MRIKLDAEYSKRLFALLLLVALVLFLGAVAELYQRRIDLTELNLRVAASLLIAILFNSLPAFVALAVVPRLASRFIHTLYDTKDIEEASGFLHRNVLGMSALRPLMIVKEGRVFVGAGSLYDRIGGRGLLIVYNDSAVVLEKGGRLTRVLGPSFGFLEPFERIWEIVDLRPQRWPLTVDAMTKEGIPISCEADITFKIDDRFIDQWGNEQTKQPVGTEAQFPTSEEIDSEIAKELRNAWIAEPLPYTNEAVFKAATSIWVRIKQPKHEEQLRKWTGRVMFSEVEGPLRSILARYRLDWLMQPSRPEHPREEIRELLKQKLLEAFPVGNSIGARILDVNLGQIYVRDVKDEQGRKIELSEKVYTQWVEAWQSGWEQRAVESRAEGEAELARLEAAQVQAQAEMVLTLTEAIRPLVASAEELPPYLLAMRFVETLRWMAYDPFKRAFMPPEIMRTLDQLQKMLGKADPPADEALSVGRLLIEGTGRGAV